MPEVVKVIPRCAEPELSVLVKLIGPVPASKTAGVGEVMSATTGPLKTMPVLPFVVIVQELIAAVPVPVVRLANALVAPIIP